MLAFSSANLKIWHLILDDDIGVEGSVTTWITAKSRAAQEAPAIGLLPHIGLLATMKLRGLGSQWWVSTVLVMSWPCAPPMTR